MDPFHKHHSWSIPCTIHEAYYFHQRFSHSFGSMPSCSGSQLSIWWLGNQQMLKKMDVVSASKHLNYKNNKNDTFDHECCVLTFKQWLNRVYVTLKAVPLNPGLNWMLKWNSSELFAVAGVVVHWTSRGNCPLCFCFALAKKPLKWSWSCKASINGELLSLWLPLLTVICDSTDISIFNPSLILLWIVLDTL